MHKSLYSLAAVAAALSFAVPATAQDDVDTGVESDDRGWNGVYFGGRLGYTFQSGDNDERILFDTDLNGRFGDTVRTPTGANAFAPGFCGGRALSATPVTATGNRGVCDDDGEGTEFAGHVGVDTEFRGFVAGVVAEYGRAVGVSDSVTAFSSTPAFYTMTRSLRDQGSVRGRIGIAAGDTLFYGTGGVAYGKVRYSQITSNVVNSFQLSTNKDNQYGYVFGGGIEQKTGRNFSIGLQYLYTDLNRDIDDLTLRVGALTTTPATNPFLRANRSGTDFRRTDRNFDRHNVSVTANFRF